MAEHDAEPRLTARETDVVARDFEEGTIVLDLRSSTYLQTNPAGAILWKELVGGTTRTRLIARLLEEFEVTEERAAADVDGFLADCQRRGLLTGGGGAPSGD